MSGLTSRVGNEGRPSLPSHKILRCRCDAAHGRRRLSRRFCGHIFKTSTRVLRPRTTGGGADRARLGFRSFSWYRLGIFQLEEKVNRKEIEQRIWGKTIASARTTGLISEQEAQFLIEEYLRDFRSKNGWDGKTYIMPRIF